jgi:hypothetical protein
MERKSQLQRLKFRATLARPPRAEAMLAADYRSVPAAFGL